MIKACFNICVFTFCPSDETRNYYTIPQTVETVERFEELTDLYGDTSYAAPTYQNETYADFYKVTLTKSVYTLLFPIWQKKKKKKMIISKVYL